MVIAGCTNSQTSTNTAPANGKTISDCETATNADAKDLCYLQTGPMSGDPDYCENIINQSVRDECVFDTALYAKNIVICDKIAGDKYPYDRVTCRATIIGNR